VTKTVTGATAALVRKLIPCTALCPHAAYT
jgi:hypothetical protein